MALPRKNQGFHTFSWFFRCPNRPVAASLSPESLRILQWSLCKDPAERPLSEDLLMDELLSKALPEGGLELWLEEFYINMYFYFVGGLMF